jgi:hypothetical protein
MGIVIVGVFYLGALFVNDQSVSDGYLFGWHFLGLDLSFVSPF